MIAPTVDVAALTDLLRRAEQAQQKLVKSVLESQPRPDRRAR